MQRRCQTVAARALACCVLICGLQSARATDATEPEGLLARWRLTSGAKGEAGAPDATEHGVMFDADGPTRAPLTAARFNGRGDWLEVRESAQLQLGTRPFSISVWVHTATELDDALGDIVSAYDPVRRKGFSLGLLSSQGVTCSQANFRQVHFGIDNGSTPQWTDRGRPGNAILPFSLAVFDGALYAGTCEAGENQSGHVYRYVARTEWADCGSPDPCNSVSALAVHRGHLYAGVSRYRLAGSSLSESTNPHLGGKIYRYDGRQSWTDCGQLPQVEAIAGLVVFRDQLYASSLYAPAGCFRYDGDRTWTSCGTPQGKRVEAMCVHNGHIYATGYDEGHVYRHEGDDRWTDCGALGDNTQTYSFAQYGGELYVGTWRSGSVFKYAADNDWRNTGRLGEELEVMGMAAFNGKLYAGTLPLAEVYRFEGDGGWTRTEQLDRTPDVKYRRAWTMAEYQGQLFCGTLPSGHVHSLRAGESVSSDRELAPGWRHLVAVKGADRLVLYVDGEPIAESEPFDAQPYDLSVEQAWRIGFGPHDYFNGRLSDLRIYGRALNHQEIQAIFQAVGK